MSEVQDFTSRIILGRNHDKVSGTSLANTLDLQEEMGTSTWEWMQSDLQSKIDNKTLNQEGSSGRVQPQAINTGLSEHSLYDVNCVLKSFMIASDNGQHGQRIISFVTALIERKIAQDCDMIMSRPTSEAGRSESLREHIQNYCHYVMLLAQSLTIHNFGLYADIQKHLDSNSATYKLFNSSSLVMLLQAMHLARRRLPPKIADNLKAPVHDISWSALNHPNLLDQTHLFKSGTKLLE